MKHLLFFTLIVIGLLNGNAQNFIISFENGKRIITFKEYSCFYDEDCQFAKVMKWAILRGQKQYDGIENIDFYSRTLVTPFVWESDNLRFSCKLQIQVTSSQFVFSFFDIVSQEEQEGIKAVLRSGRQDFNKLNPEKKKKHELLQESFLSQAKQVIAVVLNSINDTLVQISDWNAVVNGRLQQGMTLDEAYLIYGKPICIHSRDNESQADFNSFTHVLFKNNIVEKIF